MVDARATGNDIPKSRIRVRSAGVKRSKAAASPKPASVRFAGKGQRMLLYPCSHFSKGLKVGFFRWIETSSAGRTAAQ